MKAAPDRAKFWLQTGEGCLGREWPRDLDVLEGLDFHSEIRERTLANMLRSKNPSYFSSSIKELEHAIRNYKLLM